MTISRYDIPLDADNTVADLRQIANQLRTETEAADA